jgi:beta-lactamase class A
VKKPKRSTMIFALLFSIGATAGWAITAAFMQVNATTTTTSSQARPIRLGQTGLINPLLEYTTADNQYMTLSNDIAGRITASIQQGLATDVGVFFQDLNSGQWAGYNQSKKFSPASLLKVPVMMTYFRLAETTPDILNTKIRYDGSFDDNAQENIKPLKTLQAGESYTVNDLLRFMIQYSDNNADELLFSTGLSTDDFNKIYTDFGVVVPTSTSDFMSPRLYSRFFRVLYNSTYLDETMSQRALDLLAHADFPQGITAGVPENVTVAQKFGEHEFDSSVKELHNCGIVYNPSHPYVLCVMTKGDDFTKLTSVINTVSHFIWQKVSTNALN